MGKGLESVALIADLFVESLTRVMRRTVSRLEDLGSFNCFNVGILRIAAAAWLYCDEMQQHGYEGRIMLLYLPLSNKV